MDLRVLQVIPSVSLSQGGPTRALLDIERALKARGIAVTTVTTNDDGGKAKLPVPTGTRVEEANAARYYFDRSTSFYKAAFAMPRWLRENMRNFDIVHAHGLFSFAPLAAAREARRVGTPYILRPLGVLARYGVTKRRPWLKRLSFDWIERDLIEAASAVHFTSRIEKSEADAFHLNYKPVIIPLGIDLTAVPGGRDKTPSGSGEKTIFLCLSRIDPVKNLENLLRALSLVATRHGNFLLRIAGDGDAHYVDGLKKLAVELGLNDKVVWLGHIGGAEKSRALSEADVFIQASHSESFGIAVVEALACGLPCVVSQGVAISPDIAEAGAGIVAAPSADGLAAAVERMLTDVSARPAMARAARDLALRVFSLDAMGERLESLYRDIIAAGGRSSRAGGLAGASA